MLHSRRILASAIASPSLLSRRPQSSRLPINTGILFVPQQQAWVVERMGKFYKILNPGLNLLIPVIDRIGYVQILKELAIEVPHQSAITLDNVHLQIDGVLYVRVLDAFKASYGVEDPQFAITQLAQTTMRSEVGKISLDTVFREREALNVAIVDSLNKASKDDWGICCLRYEIRDMTMPTRIQEAMQMQVEAERKKRASVLESEGVREAEINVAEGRKRAQVLESEASLIDQINRAKGEAEAVRLKADAKAVAIQKVAKSIATNQAGAQAASLSVAEQYVREFGRLARNSTTMLLPSSANDPASMVAQALSIYKQLNPTISSDVEEATTKEDPDEIEHDTVRVYPNPEEAIENRRIAGWEDKDGKT